MHKTNELPLFPAGTWVFLSGPEPPAPPAALAIRVRDSLGHEMRANPIELPRFALYGLSVGGKRSWSAVL